MLMFINKKINFVTTQFVNKNLASTYYFTTLCNISISSLMVSRIMFYLFLKYNLNTVHLNNNAIS